MRDDSNLSIGQITDNMAGLSGERKKFAGNLIEIFV